MNEGLRNFAAQYNYAINDPELIRRYRMIEDGKHDIATKISVATKKAAREAAREAAKNKAFEVAKGFKRDGIDPLIIAKNTGLTLEEIAGL